MDDDDDEGIIPCRKILDIYSNIYLFIVAKNGVVEGEKGDHKTCAYEIWLGISHFSWWRCLHLRQN